MSQPDRPGSRIAGALREDAEHIIGDDLDLWPGISDRLTTRQASRHSLKQPLIDPASARDAWAGTQPRIARSTGRRGNLSMAGSLPAFVLTFAMVFLLLAAYLLPMQSPKSTDRQDAYVDACSLITQQEADGLASKHMEQFPWKPVKPNWFACSYYSEDESINILLTDFHTEAAMRDYLQTLSANSTSFNVNSRFDAGNIDTADETYTRSRKPGNETLNFWDVIVRYQSRYIIVTWMTSKPDPTASLESLAGKVTERLTSR
jgi:hypothetical protein